MAMFLLIKHCFISWQGSEAVRTLLCQEFEADRRVNVTENKDITVIRVKGKQSEVLVNRCEKVLNSFVTERVQTEIQWFRDLWRYFLFNPFIHTDQYKYLCKQCRSRWDSSAVLSGSTLFSILLLICQWNPYLQQWVCPKSEMEESMSENQGWKG